MSTEELHLKVLALLEAAAQLPMDQRESFIREQCAGNSELGSDVVSLLPHYCQTKAFQPGSGPEWFLPGTTTIGRAEDHAVSELDADIPTPPFDIGPYHCVELIGRGGMGVVYRATRANQKPSFALKLLQRGLFNSGSRWRFAFESELLRRLHHPGIARVLEANEIKTPGGTQPYFVMEYIQGRPLVQYAELEKLNTLEKLVLFANVCEPIEFAHRRGIVHRDLKPGNILVNDEGHPKVLDFGIARIEGLATDDRSGDFFGTRAYASPEQLAGENHTLTPRSDIYPLGVILHELLSGCLPARVHGKLRVDLRAVSLGQGHEAPVSELRHFVRVVLSNALADDPKRRYPSAGELGKAVNAVASEFARPETWPDIHNRLSEILSRKPSDEDYTNRPLATVLRTRLTLSMDASLSVQPEPEPVEEEPGFEIYDLTDE